MNRKQNLSDCISSDSRVAMQMIKVKKKVGRRMLSEESKATDEKGLWSLM